LKRSNLLIIIALALSSFTHIWNAAEYPILNVDEGFYLGRAIKFLDTLDPSDPYEGYDHPYFGQILLSGFLYLVGYQNLTQGSDLNYLLLLLIPRIFMGMLAVLDTFLIFKIVEVRYSTIVAFIAALLFAITPSTLLTRWILLDSLLIPLVLLSILFAVLSIRGSKSTKKIFLFTLISGTFMGLAIFTKIPAFTMIPLGGYLICGGNKKNLRNVGLWFVPVLIIPILWPLHALSTNQFQLWWDAIIWQTHREPASLYFALIDIYNFDWVLFISGISGIVYAAFKRDRFILLFTLPFLFFMFAIGHVVELHLMLLVVILCISTARLLVDIAYYLKKKNKILHLSSIGLIAVVVIMGFTGTTRQIIVDYNSQYFRAAHFLQGYLGSEQNKNTEFNETNRDVSVVSHPFFFYIDKYKYKNENNFFWYVKQFETGKIVFVIDPVFASVIEENEFQYGTEFKNLFSAFYTKPIASFKDPQGNNNVELLETNLHLYNKSKISPVNILDEHQAWNQTKYVQLNRQNGIMNLTVNTAGANSDYNLNSAILNKTIDFSNPYGYLNLIYYVPVTSDATYKFEIKDANDNSTLWEYELPDNTGITKNEFFILPQELYQKKVLLQIIGESYSKKTDSIILKHFSVYN